MADTEPARSTGRMPRGLFDQPYLLLILTMLFWSSNIVLSRGIVGHVPPVALAQLRWTIAFLVLAPFALPHLVRDARTVLRHLPLLTVLGITGVAIYNTFVYIGVQTTGAINAAMLSSLFPMVIAAMGFVIYRDRLTLMQFVGILASCIGAATILSGGSFAALRAFAFNIGDLWILGSQIAYSLYTVLLRARPTVHPLTFVTVTVFIGQLLLWPFTIAEYGGGRYLSFDFVTVASVLYVAIFPAVLAYIFFNRAVQLIGSNRVAPFFHLVPVFASIAAILFLGEHVAPYHVIGWLLILAGIAATQRFARAGRPVAPARPGDAQA